MNATYTAKDIEERVSTVRNSYEDLITTWCKTLRIVIDNCPDGDTKGRLETLLKKTQTCCKSNQ